MHIFTNYKFLRKVSYYKKLTDVRPFQTKWCGKRRIISIQSRQSLLLFKNSYNFSKNIMFYRKYFIGPSVLLLTAHLTVKGSNEESCAESKFKKSSKLQMHTWYHALNIDEWATTFIKCSKKRIKRAFPLIFPCTIKPNRMEWGDDW